MWERNTQGYDYLEAEITGGCLERLALQVVMMWFALSTLSVCVQRHRMMSSFLVFEFVIVIYWSIVDLQHCVHFCYTEERLSYTHIYIFFNILFHYGLSQDLIQYPVLYSRTLFIHSECNSLHLLIPNPQSFLPPLPLLLLPFQFSSFQSLSRVRFFATPWIAARQASLSITNSRSSLSSYSQVCSLCVWVCFCFIDKFTCVIV